MNQKLIRSIFIYYTKSDFKNGLGSVGKPF